MSNYRILIVDDEPEARNDLKRALEKDPSIEIVGLCADGLQAIEKVKEEPIDLIFLDIKMPGVDGFDVLRNIEPERMPFIVFVTAYDQYAIQAFEYHAIDYILKPYTDERLQNSLLHAKERLKSKDRISMKQVRRLFEELSNNGRITEDKSDSIIWREGYGTKNMDQIAVRSDGCIHFIKTLDIIFFEAYDAYVKIHLDNQEMIIIYNSLKALEEIFLPKKFLRIHRSFLVNSNFVRKISPGLSGDFFVHLSDGKKLNGSRKYRHNIEKLILKKT